MNREAADFARVYDAHVQQLYGFFAYRVGDRHAAEDLTQATFERALRAWSRFDPRRGSERTWLFAIARNLVIDHHRPDRSRRFESLETHRGVVGGPDERFAPALDLGSSLAQLSEREREILALRYGGDLSGAEVAALLGLTLANVHQLVSRSLRNLRRLLEAAHDSATSAPAAIRSSPINK